MSALHRLLGAPGPAATRAGGSTASLPPLVLSVLTAGGNGAAARAIRRLVLGPEHPEPLDLAGVDDELRAQQDHGQPIPDDTRRQLEAGVQAPLGDVRVHADGEAAVLAARLRARALTVGRDVYFGRGQYDPGSSAGYRLLAHEVAHTLQQPAIDGTAAAEGQLAVGEAGGPAERQADRVADRLTERRQPAAGEAGHGAAAGVGLAASATPEVARASIQRQQSPDAGAGAASPAPAAGRQHAGDDDTLTRIHDLAHQWWVGPLDESQIEDLWRGFGERLPQVASGQMALWQHCIEVGAELEDLPQITAMQGQFVEDVKQVVTGYLSSNRQVVIDEMQRLGLPAAENAEVPAATADQEEQIRELQTAAASVAKLQAAQEQARRVYVGYEIHQDMTAEGPVPRSGCRSPSTRTRRHPSTPPLMAPWCSRRGCRPSPTSRSRRSTTRPATP